MSTNLLGTEVSVRSMPIPPAYLEPEEDQPVPANEQYLPFTVRQASNTDDLRKVVEVRQRAYARHLPLVAETLKTPEQDDTEDGVVLLIAESKVDGSALGTVRIQTNRVNPLNLEQFVALPDGLRNKTIAEVRRLGVAHGMPGRLVRMLLLKAVYQYCAHNHVDWILVGARPPWTACTNSSPLQTCFPARLSCPSRTIFRTAYWDWKSAPSMIGWSQATIRFWNFSSIRNTRTSSGVAWSRAAGVAMRKR